MKRIFYSSSLVVFLATGCGKIRSFVFTPYLSRAAQFCYRLLHVVILDSVICNTIVLTNTWIVAFISFPYVVISISSTGLPHRVNLHDKNPVKCVSSVCSSVTDLLSVWFLHWFIFPHNLIKTDRKLVGVLFASLGLPTHELKTVSWQDKYIYLSTVFWKWLNIWQMWEIYYLECNDPNKCLAVNVCCMSYMIHRYIFERSWFEWKMFCCKL
jgi:hypothetical protein